MRPCRLILLAVLPLLASAALAQSLTGQDYRRNLLREYDFIDDVFQRARQIQPARRDAPARELNISDDEIREIQGVVQKLLPESIVNISTVVTGCPCEEGPMCADQVYLIATRADKTLGLQLSRIQNAWTVGAVQRWWLEYEDLERRIEKLSWNEKHAEQLALARKFPRCREQTEGKQ